MTDQDNEQKPPLLNRLCVALIRWTLIAIIVIAVGIIIYGLLPEEQQQQVKALHQDLQAEIDQTVKPKAEEALDKLKDAATSDQ